MWNGNTKAFQRFNWNCSPNFNHGQLFEEILGAEMTLIIDIDESNNYVNHKMIT